MDYTDDMLEKLQYIIEKSIRDNRDRYDSLLSGLDNILSIVNNNRNELKTPVPEEEAQTEAYNESAAQSEDSLAQDTQEDILESIEGNDNIPE